MMRYSELGNGLRISAIALGTVELGLHYGIDAVGQASKPSQQEAERLVKQAVECGINFLDTAPTYGNSEAVLGRILSNFSDVVIATKVSVPRDADGAVLLGSALAEAIDASLNNSCKALNRPTLDLVQIHNATVPIIQQGEIASVLLRAKAKGQIRELGASVYTEDEALAVISSGVFASVQVAYSVMDQRMGQRVFAAAKMANVAVLARSALLKGVLSARAEALPERLSALRDAARQLKTAWNCTDWLTLTQKSLRFCLHNQNVQSVLVGLSSQLELSQALAAWSAGPLSSDELKAADEVVFTDTQLLNPATWGLP